MEEKLVTVIVLSYNNFEFFSECIDSILKQKYKRIEIIICDDDSIQFDKQFAHDYLLKNKHHNIESIQIIINKKNIGTVKNVNNGIRNANGEYIKIIAMDDLLFSEDTICKFVEYFNQNPMINICTSNIMCFKNGNNKMIQKKIDKKIRHFKRNNYRDALYMISKECFINAPSVCFRKEFFEKNGMFCEDFCYIEDWPTWLDATLRRETIGFDSFFSVKYRVGDGLSTSKNETFKEMMRLERKKCFDVFVIPNLDMFSCFQKRYLRFLYNRSFIVYKYSRWKKILFLVLNVDCTICFFTSFIQNKAFDIRLNK